MSVLPIFFFRDCILGTSFLPDDLIPCAIFHFACGPGRVYMLNDTDEACVPVALAVFF
jgi:hypothetical protein